MSKKQQKENALALAQNRVPNCVYCKKPLLELFRNTRLETVMYWDDKIGRYRKAGDYMIGGPESHEFRCGNCGKKDDSFSVNHRQKE